MSSTENPSLELQSTTTSSQSTSIESKLIAKFRLHNVRLKSKLEALEKANEQKKEHFCKYLHINKVSREAHLRKLDMYRQRQALGDQKMHEMVYLTQSLRTRATQLGIDSDSDEDGSDDVFNGDENRNEEWKNLQRMIFSTF